MKSSIFKTLTAVLLAASFSVSAQVQNIKKITPPSSAASQVSPNDMPVFKIELGDKALVPGKGILFTRNQQSYIIQQKDVLTLTCDENIEITGEYPYLKIGLKKHTIGEKYKGGTVFFVDETGQHGLIFCEKQGPATWATFEWEYPNGDIDNNEFKDINSFASGIGIGKYNTMCLMLADTIDKNVVDPGEPYSIPYYLRNYKNDWYVPSYDELKLLYDNREALNLPLTYAERIVWSSTEGNPVYKGNNDGPNGENSTSDWNFEGYTGHKVKLTSQARLAHNGVKCIDFFTGKTLTIAKTYGKTVLFIKEF